MMPSATAPLVAAYRGHRELILALANGTVIGGEPDLEHSGKFKNRWVVPGQMPAVWIGADGERVVCTTTPEDTLLLSTPDAENEEVSQPVVIKLPHPLFRLSTTRSGPTVLPFGGKQMRVFVGLQTGVHTLASALFDASGRQLWIDEKEGPYPRTAAAADLGHAGQMNLIVDNHGKHLIYDETGVSRLIAHGWNETIPGRGDGAKYVVPIVGPFGPSGETRLLMSSGLQSVETLNGEGKRLAKRDFSSTYEFEWNSSAVGRLRASGEWDLAMVSKEGILHCIDTATCQSRWTLDLGCKASLPINIVSGDIDGDGRDNFVLGLPNGKLMAIDERDGKPVVLWLFSLEYAVKDTILADVDGDGLIELISETEDGAVHIFKAPPR
jgi:hypothetical protein